MPLVTPFDSCAASTSERNKCQGGYLTTTHMSPAATPVVLPKTAKFFTMKMPKTAKSFTVKMPKTAKS